MGKSVAILQSNYIPWKGYFDLINSVDEFILYDTEQYTRRDWRNRNLIKTPQGLQWLSIPVEVKGKYYQKINETTISDKNWGAKHWKSICLNYSRASYFKKYSCLFEDLFLDLDEIYLSNINYRFISAVNAILEINTRIVWSSDYFLTSGRNEKLIQLCIEAGATEYISGPAAKAYLNEDMFSSEKIIVKWFDYSGYQEYNQLYPPFEHGVSILDLIFNEGPNSRNFMKSFL